VCNNVLMGLDECDSSRDKIIYDKLLSTGIYYCLQGYIIVYRDILLSTGMIKKNKTDMLLQEKYSRNFSEF